MSKRIFSVIYSNKPFYSVDLTFRVDDLVAMVDSSFPKKYVNPTICKVISVERPQESYGLSDQKLEVKCLKTGLVGKVTGAEVLKYDTYLIFSVMSMFSKLLNSNFDVDIQLP